MQCPHCHTDNPDQAKFCLNCGGRLVLTCPQCGTELPPGSRFCFGCGAPVAGLPPPPPPPAAKPPLPSLESGGTERGPGERDEGPTAALLRHVPRQYAERLLATRGQAQADRRLVTILFSDFKGAAGLEETMDPEDLMEVLEGVQAYLLAPIYRYEGTLARLMGDAILAFFGAPLSHEDDAERAVRAGLEVVAGAAEYAARLAEERGISGLNARVGINTGLVVVGEVGSDLRVEYTAMGDAVNLAARLEQAAPAGGVLISHDTYRHVRGLFEVEPQEPLAVKGKAEPVRSYVVQRACPRPFRAPQRGMEGIETRMVGRETELRALQEAFQDSTAGRRTALLTVVGEAGVGKSRLAYEFERWLEPQPAPVATWKARAAPETRNAPYSVLRDLFRRRFDILDSDGAETVRTKIEAGLGPHLDAGRAHLVGHLVGFDFSATEAVRNLAGSPSFASLALAYMINYFRAVTAAGSTVVLLEDLHWADHSSLDFVAHLLEEIPDRPLLVLALARPVLYERRPDWATGPLLSPPPPSAAPPLPSPRIGRGERGEGGERRGLRACLHLHPLSTEDSQALVSDILRKVEDLPPDLGRLIVDSAEGNPFYVEEVIKMLIEDGVIVPGEERWRVEPERLKGVRVPPTLTGVLQARLDRLALEEKEVLQRAAVIGRTFWDSPLEAMVEESAVQGATLDAMLPRELVFRRERSAFAGADEYIFKHAMLRDVTYETVLLKLRRVYHRRVAQWLEGHVGDRLNEYCGLIAGHYARAAEREKAAAWFKRAGEAAWSACAFPETTAAYEQALGLTAEEDTAGRAELLLGIAQALDKMGDYGPASERYEQTLALARAGGDDRMAAAALAGLAWIAHVRGDYAQERALATERLALAQQSGDREAIARALMGYAGVQDDAATAKGYLQESLAIFRQIGNRLQSAVCLLNLGNLVYEERDWDAAAGCYEEGLAIFRQAGHRWGIGNCLANLGLVAYWRGDYEQAIRCVQEGMAVSEEIGDRENVAICLNNLGHAKARMGDAEGALDYFRRALPAAHALGAVPLILDIVLGMAGLQAQRGDPAGAAEMVGLLLNHPARDTELQMFAEPVLAELGGLLPAAELAAALERGQGLDLEQVVEALLRGT